MYTYTYMAVSVWLMHANSQAKIHVPNSAQICRPQDLLDDPSNFGALRKKRRLFGNSQVKKKGPNICMVCTPNLYAPRTSFVFLAFAHNFEIHNIHIYIYYIYIYIHVYNCLLRTALLKKNLAATIPTNNAILQ